MRLFHIATVADWDAARRQGSYTTSTRGRTLAQEGFIHASRAEQWPGVHQRFYADVDEPLVLLVIDPKRLDVPVVEEAVPSVQGTTGGSAATFPHLYGPLRTDAVVQVLPIDADGRVHPPSFSRLFLGEVFVNVALTCLVLLIAVVGTLVGTAVEADAAPLVGLATGLAVGVVAARVLQRRRNGRAGPSGR